MLMKTVQMPGAEAYESQMVMHTSTANTNIILARGFKNFFQTQHGHMACWIMVSFCFSLLNFGLYIEGLGLYMLLRYHSPPVLVRSA